MYRIGIFCLINIVIDGFQIDLLAMTFITLFFFAGYFIFLKNSNIISPITRRKIFDNNGNILDDNLQNNEEDLNFLLCG
jgi:hypothetical protein